MFGRYKECSVMALAAIFVLFVVGTASAQMDNRPFSFRNSPQGGPGMSGGGKQAIIQEKLFGETPDNMLRGPDGRLLDVIEGPGDSAIVLEHGTARTYPGYHGTSFRGDSDLMQVGVFNAYFGPLHDSTGFAGYSYAQLHTANMINSWTMGMIANGAAPVYFGSNPVDSWTVFVSSLNRF